MDVEHAFSHFDHNDRAFAQEPHATYSALRSRCPVAHSDRHGGFYVVSRYDDIRTVTEHPEAFSNQEITVPPAPEPSRNIPGFMDPPDHARYRAMIAGPFSPARMLALEGKVRQIVDAVIDEFVTEGTVDVVPTLSREVPRRVLVDLLGVRDEDVTRFQRWVDTILGVHSYDEDVDDDLRGYLSQLVEERKAAAGDADDDGGGGHDVISQLVGARARSESLTNDEVVRMLLAVIEGGLHTTPVAITGTVLLLAQNPELGDRLRREPELHPLAVEELLRWTTPVQGLARVVTTPFELDGNELRPGDRVLLLWASGNRDETVFENPDLFVLDRTPNPHLTFGHGIHRCLGMHLARLELRLVLQQVLDRLDHLRLPEQAFEWHGGATRGLMSLRVEFTPGPRVTGSAPTAPGR